MYILMLPTLFPYSGNVYIADTSNHRIRKVTVSTGIISTIAGSGGTGSFSGDNGPATAAVFNDPHSVAIDASGMTPSRTYIIVLSLMFLLFFPMQVTSSSRIVITTASARLQ